MRLVKLLKFNHIYISPNLHNFKTSSERKMGVGWGEMNKVCVIGLFIIVYINSLIINFAKSVAQF